MEDADGETVQARRDTRLALEALAGGVIAELAGVKELTAPRMRTLRRPLGYAILVATALSLARVQLDTLQATIAVRQLQDFGLFHAQAGRVRRGETPYGPVVRYSLTAPDDHPNLNPPHFQVVMLAFALLPPVPAFVVWCVLSGIGLLVSLGLMLRALGARGAPAWLWAVTLALAATPTFAVCVTGQLTFLLLPLVTWAWVAARRGARMQAGVALGLAASCKPFLLLGVVALAVRREWMAAASATATVIAASLVGLLVFGVEGWRGYLTALGSVDWAGAILNGSWSGVLDRAAHGATPPWPLTAAGLSNTTPLLVLGLVTIGTITLLRVAGTSNVDGQFLTWSSAALLLSPLGWLYYFWFLAGPAVLVARESWRAGRVADLIALAVSAAALLTPPSRLTLGQPSGWATITIGSAYFWSLLLIWLVSLRAGVRLPDPARTP